MRKKFTEFYQAWEFLNNHPIFADTTLLKNHKWDGKRIINEHQDIVKGCKLINPRWLIHYRLESCLHVDLVKVNPKIMAIDEKDKCKNTKVQVWLECGPWQNPEEITDPDELEMAPNGWNLADFDLDCGADTYELAIIKLANQVLKKYGHGRKRLIQLIENIQKAA